MEAPGYKSCSWKKVMVLEAAETDGSLADTAVRTEQGINPLPQLLD
jgi:hypothetical protein